MSAPMSLSPQHDTHLGSTIDSRTRFLQSLSDAANNALKSLDTYRSLLSVSPQPVLEQDIISSLDTISVQPPTSMLSVLLRSKLEPSLAKSLLNEHLNAIRKLTVLTQKQVRQACVSIATGHHAPSSTPLSTLITGVVQTAQKTYDLQILELESEILQQVDGATDLVNPDHRFNASVNERLGQNEDVDFLDDDDALSDTATEYGDDEQIDPNSKEASLIHYYAPMLRECFENGGAFPTKADREMIVEVTGIPYRCIGVWFQNRREERHRVLGAQSTDHDNSPTPSLQDDDDDADSPSPSTPSSQQEDLSAYPQWGPSVVEHFDSLNVAKPAPVGSFASPIPIDDDEDSDDVDEDEDMDGWETESDEGNDDDWTDYLHGSTFNSERLRSVSRTPSLSNSVNTDTYSDGDNGFSSRQSSFTMSSDVFSSPPSPTGGVFGKSTTTQPPKNLFSFEPLYNLPTPSTDVGSPRDPGSPIFRPFSPVVSTLTASSSQHPALTPEPSFTSPFDGFSTLSPPQTSVSASASTSATSAGPVSIRISGPLTPDASPVQLMASLPPISFPFSVDKVKTVPFSFGAISPPTLTLSNSKESSTPPFQFGATPSPASASPASRLPSQPFMFGASSSPTPASSTLAFTFGASSCTTPAPSSSAALNQPFTFGTKSVAPVSLVPSPFLSSTSSSPSSFSFHPGCNSPLSVSSSKGLGSNNTNISSSSASSSAPPLSSNSISFNFDCDTSLLSKTSEAAANSSILATFSFDFNHPSAPQLPSMLMGLSSIPSLNFDFDFDFSHGGAGSDILDGLSGTDGLSEANIPLPAPTADEFGLYETFDLPPLQL